MPLLPLPSSLGHGVLLSTFSTWQLPLLVDKPALPHRHVVRAAAAPLRRTLAPRCIIRRMSLHMSQCRYRYDFGAGFGVNALVNAFIGDAFLNSFALRHLGAWVRRPPPSYGHGVLLGTFPCGEQQPSSLG